jgi:hypothetical protein
VSTVPHLGASVRRLLRLACVCAVAVVLAAPLLLGPAMTPVMRALGSEPSHHCACGMEPGKCGCAECAHAQELELPGVAERPVLKSTCDDGGDALPVFAALPFAMVPYLARLPAPAGERAPEPVAPARLLARDRARPPTPPPRG